MKAETCDKTGLSIPATATLLRNLAAIERARVRILAGWFLRLADYDHKYRLAYHLHDSAEHVSWLYRRLREMRGGNANASVRPQLSAFLAEVLDAPSDRDFLAGFYGLLSRSLLHAVDQAMESMDASANANEQRLLERMRLNLAAQMRWYEGLGISERDSGWARYLEQLLQSVGGLSGDSPPAAAPANQLGVRFVRPQTIVFDERIRRSPLATYEERQDMDQEQATIEQFRVFFNEFYAAALLASILFDAADGEYPWEFFEDFSRHFWDEARHSEFGALRLRELGSEPDRVDPVLFEESQGLPVLHRVAYLTRGLEAYFMPRKPKRMKEYEASGDRRSQIFADQDWSDEINHVRYGSRWTEHLLQEDAREIEDIIEECKQHLSRERGAPVTDIRAPF